MRNKSIEVWRLVFSLLIVLCHSTALPWMSNDDIIFKSASIGVEFFFILSGYLMAASAEKRNICEGVGTDTWQYIWKKVKGISPCYFCALFLELLGGVMRNQAYTVREIPFMIWDILFLRTAGLQGPKLNMLVGASWYLCAMLLSMWILYPFALKFKDMFLNVIAPLLAIFILGWFSNTYGNIKFQLDFEKGICLGMLRGMAELSVGCVCYVICRWVQKIRIKSAGRVLITIAELLSMLCVICTARNAGRSQLDFICILLISIGMIAAFSGKSYTVELFSRCKLSWAGEYSLALYLTHVMWVRNLSAWKLPVPYGHQVAILLIMSLATAVVCMFTVNAVRALNQYRKRKYAAKNQEAIHQS